MYLLIALAVNISFFFVFDLGLIAKVIGLGVCAFLWASNRNGVLNVEGAAGNPLVVQFMLVGSIGVVIGSISLAIDIFS